MDGDYKKKTTERMQHAIDAMKKDYATIRTGRASVALLDGVMVESYGSHMPISQVATLSTPDARQIVVQPWDPKGIGAIERAIQQSDLGLNPTNDGRIIRLAIPALTEERRRDLVKVAKKRAEEGKVAVRNVRRDINEELKKQNKDKAMTDDELKGALDEVQKMTDSFIKRVDDVLAHKEAEIMEV